MISTRRTAFSQLQFFRITVALASSICVQSACADVIYSNLLNTTIPTDFDGVTINIDGGTLNPFFGGVAVANNAALQPLREGTGGMDTILNLSFGSTVDGNSLYLSSGDGGSQDHLGNTFTAGQEGYIGFKLNNANYGWMRVIFTNNTGGALVKDWAYDSSGTAITVGGVRQVGQDIILSSPFTLSSALTNSGGTTNLVKNSAGTNTLTATSTYTGTTTVSAGTLAIGGSGSINQSDVTIAGGTFRYNSSVAYGGALTFTNGTIGGTNLTGTLGGLTIGANQTISPGNSVDTVLTTSQTWAGGGTYEWEMNDAAGTEGTDPGWDLISGSGSLTITANSGSRFTIAVNSLGLNDLEGDAAGFNDLSDYDWLIAQFDSITGFDASDFTIDTSGFTNAFTGTFAVALGDQITGGTSNQIYLTYRMDVIPEPQTALLVGLGALALLRRRRI